MSSASEASPEPIVLSATEPADIVRASAVLREGGVVVIPTDTIYALAASALNAEAVARVFALKGRAPDVPVPVLLASAADLPVLVRATPGPTWRLIEGFWPGALTLALPARSSVDRTITAGGDTVAVRVPAGRAVLELLQVLGDPIVGTSANRSGAEPSARGLNAAAGLLGQVDAVLLDDEHVPGGPPSTVAEVREDMVVVHREGAVPLEALRRAAGVRVVAAETLAQLTRTT